MLGLVIMDMWWLVFMIPGALLALYAQSRLASDYGRYLQEPAQTGLSGAEAARAILDHAGLFDVGVHEVPGRLSDHYDPTKRALFLSSDNFHSRSLSAVGVAAHEAGHALQHQQAYAPLQIRMSLVPVTNFASNAAAWIMLAGALAGLPFLRSVAPFAIAAFAAVTLFHLVTLPVEYDASRRAKDQLLRLGLITRAEHGPVNRVLGAAALTYVAAMIGSLSQLLYLVMLSRGDDRN